MNKVLCEGDGAWNATVGVSLGLAPRRGLARNGIHWKSAVALCGFLSPSSPGLPPCGFLLAVACIILVSAASKSTNSSASEIPILYLDFLYFLKLFSKVE